MRTNIEIDDELLTRAQRVAGTSTKRSTVDYALRELVRRKDRQAVVELHGATDSTSHLDASRGGHLA